VKNTIKATFSIVTPMFLGDAEQKAIDIRPPSIKGALRFWWRALNWARISAECADIEVDALKKLHSEEGRLFGISAGDDDGGQGIFLLNVLPSKIEKSEQPFKDMDGAQLYLLGMGLGSFKGGNHTLRNALVSGDFTVRLLFRSSSEASDQQSIRDALYAFGLLGALGSRARHGMGSISLKEWEGDARKVPQNVQEYQAAIASLLGRLGEALPPYTAFSQKTRIDISAQNEDPIKLLSKVGIEQQLYRSFGRNNKVQGKPAERKFTNDHDLIMAATKGNRIEAAPQRAVFGLPHNYSFSSSGWRAEVEYAPDGGAGRRSSPLLLHIHGLPDGQFIAVHSLLPAQFLPKNAQMLIQPKPPKEDRYAYKVSSKVPVNVDWQVIHNYLNRFEQKETIYGAK
jgi:CRISPR-associated protein Cmr1